MQSGLYDTCSLAKECPNGYVKVCEGSTAVLFPPAMLKKGERDGSSEDASGKLWAVEDEEAANDAQSVFYNPAQVVNRDLSICAIELFARRRRGEPARKGGGSKGITILEALSATGLRAIRYFKEISNVQLVIANDMDADAVRCIRQNCEFNDVPVGRPTHSSNFDIRESAAWIEEKSDRVLGGVVPNLDDAVDLMHRLGINPGVHKGGRLAMSCEGGQSVPVIQQELMDVVDLDPYGSASPFLEGAFHCIKEGGLMLVTSTDSAVLCGNYMDTCHAKYNSVPYKGAHCHEMAVRILLSTIERCANKHKKYIVPLVSLHIDFYIRCFFRVYTQPAEVKLSPCKLAYQLQCSHCPTFWVRPTGVERPSRPKALRKRQRQDGAGGKAPSAPPDNEEETKSLCTAPLRREVFPSPPSRSTNPRLVCPSLGSLQCKRPTYTAALDHDGGAESPQAAPTEDAQCPVCGSPIVLSGPIYAGATQDRDFLTDLLKVIEERNNEKKITATARINGLVQVALEELPECPLFYNLPDIASYVKVRCPPTPNFVAALGRLGYRCSQVHCEPSGIKTDCPPDVLFAVMLQWKALQDKEDSAKGIASASLKAQQVKLRITPLTAADFTYEKKYDFRRDSTGIAKFIPNAPGWGPKRRHTGAAVPEEE